MLKTMKNDVYIHLFFVENVQCLVKPCDVVTSARKYHMQLSDEDRMAAQGDGPM